MTDFRSDFPRQEVAWPHRSLARYLKAFTPSWGEDHLADFQATLQAFAQGDDDRPAAAMHASSAAYSVYAHHRSVYLRQTLQDAADARAAAERSAVWGRLAFRLEAELALDLRRREPAARVWADFQGAVAHAAHLLRLGWDDDAAAQTRRLMRLLRTRCVLLDADKFATHHLAMRLLADWQGVSAQWRWPKAALKVPVFERIVAIWRDPTAAEELAHLLAVACERHWLQSSTSDRKHHDLGHTWEFYDAFEVLTVRALRERLGLEVAAVEHPLAELSPARPQPSSAPAQDPLCEAVERRARALLPMWDREGADFDPA